MTSPSEIGSNKLPTIYLKDVIPAIYLEIHNFCYEAYKANPLAYAIIEQTTSFVLGEGIKVSANNKKVQQVIDAFWNNPGNRMDEAFIVYVPSCHCMVSNSYISLSISMTGL